MNPQKVLRLSLLSLGFAIPAAASFAQDTSTPPAAAPAPDAPPADAPQPRRRGGYVLEDLTAKLNLTADQQKSVGDAIKAGRDNMRAIRGDDSLSDDDKRAKSRAAMAATKAQIRALLTPDQQAIFDKLPARGGPPPAPPADGAPPANPPPSN
jgi:Spy/CpxP family protein refolding chaperone